MAIIPQQRLFSWEQIEGLGDLERFVLALNYLPDEKLMVLLESRRGLGRDDYPVRAMWNALLAGIVYQHCSVASLLRELLRNAQLRHLCGFDKVPTPWAFSRFLSKLLSLEEEIMAIFNDLIEQLTTELPDFGENLAIDGKAIPTHTKPHKEDKDPDGRRDTDADFGKKVYRGRHEDGSKWKKVVSWFGYRLHVIVDSKYELPVAFNVTKASPAEGPQAHLLLNEMEMTHPELIERCRYFSGDRGYDDGKLICRLWDDYNTRPIIDIRNMWKDGEQTRLLNSKSNVVTDYRGTIYCYCLVKGLKREMPFGSFDQDRQTLRYRCPALHFEISCAGKEKCPAKAGVRIRLAEDRRIFTPVARSSYKWKKLYRMRTATERVNSRLDVSFGFENHYIRGLKKMQLRVGLALCVMLAMALGRIKQNQHELMRSLVKAA